MGFFRFNHLKKMKDGALDGMVIGRKLHGRGIDDFFIPDDMLLMIFKYCVRLYINKLGGIYKELYDLWQNNLDKEIHIMVPIEDRKSPLEPVYYNILSIGKGISDEMTIHTIFSIRSDMAIDNMYRISDPDGQIIGIYLKFSSRDTEVDE